MKMLNKIFFLFFINCIFVFSVENNNFNSEKLGENIILEVREISLNGGERRKIYFSKNGEIEDIFFDEWNSNIYVENFLITDKNLIDFINDFSLEAINSVKNDSIIYEQNYKNKKFDLYKGKISFDYVGKFFGRNEGEILFNGKNKIINYRKVYNFSNDILEIPKNNVKLYEVVYKNKCFYIIDDKSEYTNKEIRILIDLISFPLFSRKEIKKESKNIDENSLNIEIEKVKLLNNSNNGYISYKITDENKIERISYNKTAFSNQFDVEKKEMILDEKIIQNLKKDIEKLKLNNQNLESKNSVIYKIYDEILNLYYILSNKNIFEKIENEFKNKNKINIEKINSVSNNSIKNLQEKNIVMLDVTLHKENDFDYYLRFNGKKTRILLKDYSIETKNEDEMEMLVKRLRDNWDYKGMTPDENIDDLLKTFKEFREFNKNQKNEYPESDLRQHVESFYKMYDHED